MKGTTVIMTIGTARLTLRHRRCPSCGSHRVGYYKFLCGPCWDPLPEEQKAHVWAVILGAVAKASELREART